MKKSIFFLLGPTCVGKTDLSIKLFDFFKIEVINLDSSMFYKFMNIGTGKPSLFLRKKFKHYLFDILDPVDFYSVNNFCFDAFKIVLNCIRNDKIPFFVGGSMMYAWYLQNFFYFFKFNHAKKNINKEFLNVLGLKQDFLNDFSITCKSFTDLFLTAGFNGINFNFVNIFLLPFNKDIFYCKIKERFFSMLEKGFLKEVEFLHLYYNLKFNYNSINSIGYREFLLYLNNKIDFLTAMDLTISSTFNLAHNQLKWIKKFGNNSFYIENKDHVSLKSVIKILSQFNKF